MLGSARARARADELIRSIHELLGHKNVRTTMIYTQVLDRSGWGAEPAGCAVAVPRPGDFPDAP